MYFDAPYDESEMSVLSKMKKALMVKHGWEADDFEGMTFLDVEAEFLDVEAEFRSES